MKPSSKLKHDIFRSLAGRLWRYSSRCADLRGQGADPILAAYLSPGLQFVIDVEMGRCLGLHSLAFSYRRGGGHPFVVTLLDYACGQGQTYEGSALEQYYACSQPRNAADALGLEGDAVDERLRGGGPLASSLPWDVLAPQAHEEFWTGIATRDYVENGFSLDASHGWKAWGPASAAAGKAEFTRLVQSYLAIKKHGYVRHSAYDGDIEGRILTSGGDYRILIERGQHRIAALAALGFDKLPVRLAPASVRREEAAFWPQVVSGVYTTEQALFVFDRMFEARQPAFVGSVRIER